MGEEGCLDAVKDQTGRAPWEVRNVLACIPDALWERSYCGSPLWQHVYHMLHSLDRWLINPCDPHYREPSFHLPGLNDLDIPPAKSVTRREMDAYAAAVAAKVRAYLCGLREEELPVRPAGCPYTRFTLILAQHRHLHSHMGMLMGFLIADTGRWPLVLGLEREIPRDGVYGLFY